MDEVRFSEFVDEISQWDWDLIIADMLKNGVAEQSGPDELEIRMAIGTSFSMNPSGKYWVCLSTNIPDEYEDDTLFHEALEKVALQHDIFISCGEDPTDIILTKYISYNETKK